MILRSVFALLIVLLFAVSCNVLKKDDTNESIQTFLTSFQSNLALADAEILKQFDAKQSSESILAGIRILQNKESTYFECVASPKDATIVRSENDIIRVIIPAVFTAKNLEEKSDPVQTSFTLWLQKKKDSFVIVQLEADAFYSAYAKLKNDLQWSVQRQEAIDHRTPLYNKARELQHQFDSVIWFSTYKEKNYFYVVKGDWGTEADNSGKIVKTDYLMGLVDENGSIIIPLEYQLIGTIGFDYPQLVEVKKNNKYGYFNVESGKLVADVLYDMIIPYNNGVKAIAKMDTLYGSINDQFEFTPGFPTGDAREWVNSFGFLPDNLRITGSQPGICERPGPENAGNGIFIPPSYLRKTGLFGELVVGISTTPFPLNGWTEYVETKGTLYERITDGFNAVITTINERYLEGREEFYTHNRLVFVDGKTDTLSVSDINTDSVIHIKRISDNLIEVKSAYPDAWYEPGVTGELDFPMYTYFSLGENLSITQLTSQRSFSFTEFARLDSTYLMGDFKYWREDLNEEEQLSFAHITTLNYMRNEILASYGYVFPASEHNPFADFQWYKPRHNSIEEFKDQLTEVDKHNLEFLERIINLVQTKPV